MSSGKLRSVTRPCVRAVGPSARRVAARRRSCGKACSVENDGSRHDDLHDGGESGEHVGASRRRADSPTRHVERLEARAFVEHLRVVRARGSLPTIGADVS